MEINRELLIGMAKRHADLKMQLDRNLWKLNEFCTLIEVKMMEADLDDNEVQRVELLQQLSNNIKKFLEIGEKTIEILRKESEERKDLLDSGFEKRLLMDSEKKMQEFFEGILEPLRKKYTDINIMLVDYIKI